MTFAAAPSGGAGQRHSRDRHGQSATGIDEPTYHALKRDAANGTEPAAPRQ